MNTFFTVPLSLYKTEIYNTSMTLVQFDNESTQIKFKVYNNDVEIDYSQLKKVTLVTKQSSETPIVCQCDIETDHISYMLCYEETCCVGQVLGELNLYYNDSAKKSTQKFRYSVIPTLAIGIDPTKHEELPILQALISECIKLNTSIKTLEDAIKFAESTRIQNEEIRNANEQARVQAEANREDAESIRKASETLRNDAEVLRVNAESARVTAESNRATEENKRVTLYNQISNDYPLMADGIITTAYNNACPMINCVIETMTESTLTFGLFYNPIGYDYDITDITIISEGDAVGITSTNTCFLEILKNFETIVGYTFDDYEIFPSANAVKTFNLQNDGYNDTIVGGDLIHVRITNGVGVTTPKFTLQLNYKIKQSEVMP